MSDTPLTPNNSTGNSTGKSTDTGTTTSAPGTTPINRTLLTSAAARRPTPHRLSPVVVAVTVIGLVAAGGAIGATVGSTSSRNDISANSLPLPDEATLTPIAVDRSVERGPIGGSLGGAEVKHLRSFATASTLAPITRPPSGATPTTRASAVTLAPKPRPGSGTPTTAGATATTKVTATTVAAPPASGTTRRRTPVTTTAAPATTIDTTPFDTTPFDDQSIDTTPIDTTDDTSFTPDTELAPPTTFAPITRTGPTTTVPAARSGAISIGNGLVIVPAKGYQIINRWKDGGVLIGNGASLVDTWTGTGANIPAAQIVGNVIDKYLPQRFESIEYKTPNAQKPPKTSIRSFASAEYRGVLAGDQGSTSIEGLIIVAVRQDGLAMFFVATWVEGAFDDVAEPISAMLGSTLANM